MANSTPRQALCLPSVNLGHSMASSCPSSSTNYTTSRWGFNTFEKWIILWVRKLISMLLFWIYLNLFCIDTLPSQVSY